MAKIRYQGMHHSANTIESCSKLVLILPPHSASSLAGVSFESFTETETADVIYPLDLTRHK
jgi:hypothetical protein